MQRRALHAWEFYPQKLSEEEIKDPYSVLIDFFDYDYLPFIREMMWEWLKATVTDDYCRAMSNGQRNNLLYFYEQLERLIEAAHVIKERQQKLAGKSEKDPEAGDSAPLSSSPPNG